MDKYIEEASAKNQKGRIICASGAGYNPTSRANLEQVLTILD